MAQDLKRCAEGGRVDELRALLDAGTDPNEQLDDGSVALHWACMKDQTEVVRLLLARNAVADMITNDESQTPLHWAASAGAIVSMHLLITTGGADLRASDARGYTALHHAAQGGQGVAAQFLIQAGLPVDCADSEGHTPLHWAAYCNHPQVCEVLVSLGAELNKQDNDGFTALHWAATKGNWHVANYLVQAGADRNVKDNESQTAEDIATKKHNGLVAGLLTNANHWTAKLKEQPLFWVLFGALGLPLLVQVLASQRSLLAIAILAAVSVATWHFFGRLWSDLQNLQSFWLGLVLGSVAVSAVCYANYLLPAVRTDMISNMLFVGFVCFGSFTAWQLSRSDPGRLPLNQDILAESLRALEGQKSTPAFCALCLSRQPIRSRHCDSCKRCTARFSRHITVLGCCVGARNFVLFVATAASLVLTHIMFLRFCLLAWTRHATNPALFDGMAHVAWPALLHTAWLLYESWHLYGEIVAISKNLTSYEYADPRLCDYLYPESVFRNPFDRGNAIENARAFLFGRTDWARTWSLPVEV